MQAKPQVVTKTAFADITGVTAGRVSQWIADGKISGKALVGRGHRARIRIDVAQKQLNRNLDVSQHLGAHGRAKLNGNGAEADQVVDGIRRAKLKQLRLGNDKLTAEAAVRSGRYIRTDDAQLQIGRVNARWLSLLDAALIDFANVVVRSKPATTRDALLALRAAWHQIREREAKVRNREAAAMPPLIEDKKNVGRKR